MDSVVDSAEVDLTAGEVARPAPVDYAIEAAPRAVPRAKTIEAGAAVDIGASKGCDWSDIWLCSAAMTTFWQCDRLSTMTYLL